MATTTARSGTRPGHRWAGIAVAALVLASCSGSSSDAGEAEGSGRPATTATGASAASTTVAATTTTGVPAAEPGHGPTGEWEVEAPEENGMDPAVLAQVRDYAFARGRNTQSVVVVRHGVIVAEWYAPGSDADSWVASWSVAKSFASAAIGIAIGQGKIPSVDEPMTTYFPEWKGSPREDMTLEDVLQMQSGLDWVEDYDATKAAESDVIQQVIGTGDQLDYAVDQPAKVAPGTRWNYSSGDAMLLSGVLEQATGMSAAEFAQQELLDPIGIDGAEWWSDTSGHTLTYCCFDATSRDLARFGQLYLDGGAWGDRQVVPADWVASSVVGSEASKGIYGYQWWLEEDDPIPADHFDADGHDGQWIHVIPSLDLVVVRNGTYVKDPGEPVADPNLLETYPPDGLVPGKGTLPPDEWSDTAFLTPIVESITD